MLLILFLLVIQTFLLFLVAEVIHHKLPRAYERKKPSFVWNFASKTHDRNYASCNICGAFVPTSHGGTTSLRNHLKHKHEIQE